MKKENLDFTKYITSFIYEELSDKYKINAFFIYPTKKIEQGDFFSNICFLNNHIKNIQDIIIEVLLKIFFIDKVISSKGFINIFLKDKYLLQKALQENNKKINCKNIISNESTGVGGEYSKGPLDYINIEYGSINPTGPLHIGHCRGLIIGSALSNILKTEKLVIQEYYINDCGVQISKLTESVFSYINIINKQNISREDILSEEQLLHLTKELNLPEITYRGEFIQDISYSLKDANINSPQEFHENYKDKIIDLIFQNHMSIIKKLNIKYDIFTKESSILENRDEAMDYLCKTGQITIENTDNSQEEKILEKWDPNIKGKIKMIIKDDKEDQDSRTLRRENNMWTYFANDICFHWRKIKRGASCMIGIMGEDHIGYFPRLKEAVSLINSKIKFDLLSFAMVHIKDDDNEIVRMSKRKGNIITIEDVANIIGYESLKVLVLMHSIGSVIEINIKNLQETWRDNPFFTIQYAYARLFSVERAFDPSNTVDLQVENYNCESLQERYILRQICVLDDVMRNTIDNLSPNILMQYIHDLSLSFHSWWGLGKVNSKMRFISEDSLQTCRRIVILKRLRDTIKNIMDLLGIELKESM